jgi:hypothetical protein
VESIEDRFCGWQYKHDFKLYEDVVAKLPEEKKEEVITQVTEPPVATVAPRPPSTTRIFLYIPARLY